MLLRITTVFSNEIVDCSSVVAFAESAPAAVPRAIVQPAHAIPYLAVRCAPLILER